MRATLALLLCATCACTAPRVAQPPHTASADAGVLPSPDAGVAPTLDAGVQSPDAGPISDAGWPVPDGGVAVFALDAGVTFSLPDGGDATFVCSLSTAPLTPSGICEDTFCWDAPAPTGRNLLSSWSVAINDVWFGGDRTLLHWDGQSWTWFPDDTSVTSLWASGPDDVWAVDGAGVLHWDGQAWTRAFAHAKAGVVSGSGPSDVWLTAPDALWRFDGATWSPVDVPVFAGPPSLVQVDGVDDVWVSFDTQMGHWDGQTWTVSDPKLTDEDIGLSDNTMRFSAGAPSLLSGGAWGLCAGDGMGAVSCQADGGWTGGSAHDDFSEDDSWKNYAYALYALSPNQCWASVEEVHEEAFDQTDYGTSVTGPSGSPLSFVGQPQPAWGTGDEDIAEAIVQTLTGSGSNDIWAAGDGFVAYAGDAGTTPAFVPHMNYTTALWDDQCGNEYVLEYQEAYWDYVTLWHRQGDRWLNELPRKLIWQYVNGWGTNVPLAIGGLPGREPWAVGTNGYLARHLAGAWQPLPSGTTGDLTSLWTDRPDELWAAGPGTALHWTSSQVAVYSLPDSSTIWAEGTRLTGSSSSDLWLLQPGTLRHFDGSSWSLVEFPAGGTVADIQAPSAGTLVAMGSIAAADGGSTDVAWQWSSGMWTQLLALNDGSSWTTLVARAPNELWLGTSNGAIEHFDGSSWTSIPVAFAARRATSDIGLTGETIDPLASGQLWIATGKGLILMTP